MSCGWCRRESFLVGFLLGFLVGVAVGTVRTPWGAVPLRDDQSIIQP
jgi:hypothetical protein